MNTMNEQDNLKSAFNNSNGELDEETRQELNDIWDQAGNADPAESIEVADSEIGEAYKKVQGQINTETASRTYWKYAAAAVFLLFAIGIAYVLIPVTITVPNGETQTVQLPDQSTVQLNSGSQLNYSRLFNWWNREVSLKGEAFFDVQSNGLPFRVTTGNASVKVLGTKFNVRYWPSENDSRTSVFLSEGMVTFQSLTADESVMLKPGEQSWVSNIQKTPVEPVSVDKEKAVAWQQNSIAFENRSLASVFAELERRFDVIIDANSDIVNENITIYLSDVDEVETAIKDICRAKGLTYQKGNGTFRISSN